jgi:hypothetical protein
LVQLRVEWHWDPHVGRPKRLSGHEELLAVSYDTQALVWLGEQAPAGIGADGDTLRRLEQSAGADGARRLFVIPEGEDGHVTLQFQPRQPGTAPAVEPFRVFVAFASPSSHVLTAEAALPSDDSQLASMNRTLR